MARIRDPIHGAIPVDERERAVIDSPAFQRLRHVRQLGFADLAFPGASHSRYAHALGAAHVVGRVFTAVTRRVSLGSERERERLRAAVRVATLLHDAGHAPFSHSSEPIMPPRATLGLPAWAAAGPAAERATHEDFTLHLVLNSELTDVLRQEYGPLDLPPEAIASIVAGREGPGGPYFVAGGVDCAPLLRQVVSSELDADRMDYLLRDSFYTGVNYGKFDLDWLTGGLGAHVHDGRAELSLSSRAIFAFEDFLLSRYHMFLSVYFHHTPTCFDHLLALYYHDSPGEFEVPADASAFLACDDVTLLTTLRRSPSPWARRITRREPFRLLVESSAYDTGWDLAALTERLREAEVECFRTESKSMVSKYFGAGGDDPPIWVAVRDQGRYVPLLEYTPLFQRYEEAARIERLYVEPLRLDDARRIAGVPA